MTIKNIKEETIFSTNGFRYIVVEEHAWNNPTQKLVIVKNDAGAHEVHIWRLRKLSSKLFTSDYTHFWRKPTNEEFGTYGWSYHNIMAARRKCTLLQEMFSDGNGIQDLDEGL